MEDTLISIDSKYRDFNKYPDESNFTFILEKIYKNVVSVKLNSLELTNSINYVSSSKKNNYITLHLPNKLNDPDGIILKIDETQNENIDNISTQFSSSNLFNPTTILNKYPEKYFYIFYLCNPCSIVINSKNLTISIGWYSIYGIVNIIQNYIQTNKKVNNNFDINSFTLNIFDRRYPDNTRIDSINSSTYSSNNLDTNLITFKNFFYSSYLIDVNTFIPVNNSSGGILDKLLHTYKSIYYINNSDSSPTQSNILLYNLNLIYSTNNSFVSFNNDFSSYYYTINDWTTNIQFTNLSINLQDIPSFAIDFSNITGSNYSRINGIVNINSLTYPSLGYYLGYRINNGSYLLAPTFSNNTNLTLTATKKYNTVGEDYIFLKINNWGNFDFFNQVIFSKIFLRSDLTTNNKTNNYINKEYVFRQLTNISKLDIQLIDYLGNQVDLNGIDFSFTLSLRIQANIGQKQLFELQNFGNH